MITLDKIGSKIQYRTRNMYTQRYNYAIRNKHDIVLTRLYLFAVYSYTTLIGYADLNSHRFYTWGYGRYSKTTSKQITMFCNELSLTRYDIVDMSVEGIIERFYL